MSFSFAPAPCVIKGEPVVAVQKYKYLDTVLDKKIKFEDITLSLKF